MMLRFVVISAAVSAVLALSGCGGRVADMAGKVFPKWGGKSERVVLINTFTVPADKTDEAVKMWNAANEFMREQDGYISTKLHLSLDENTRYRLVNIARWQSPAHFRAAAKALRQSGVLRPIDGVRGDPALYKVIKRTR